MLPAHDVKAYTEPGPSRRFRELRECPELELGADASQRVTAERHELA